MRWCRVGSTWGAVTVFGWGAGTVQLLFGNASDGGTVPVGKCVRSLCGFHSAKRAVGVRVGFETVSGRGADSIMKRCRFSSAKCFAEVQVHGRFGSGRGTSSNSFRPGMWYNFMFVSSQVRVQVRVGFTFDEVRFIV